jgi:ribosomal protein L7/L12
MDWGSILLLVSVAFMVLCSYMDTKARIARIEHKLNLLLRQSGIDLLKGLPLSERVQEIARDPARKIEAIKVYREESGAGLAEAKDAVELYINSQ